MKMMRGSTFSKMSPRTITMVMTEIVMMEMRMVMENQPIQCSQFGNPIILVSSFTPACFSSTILCKILIFEIFVIINIKYGDLQHERDSEGEGEDRAERSEEELDSLEYVEIL